MSPFLVLWLVLFDGIGLFSAVNDFGCVSLLSAVVGLLGGIGLFSAVIDFGCVPLLSAVVGFVRWNQSS